jgi:hypothetical protein
LSLLHIGPLSAVIKVPFFPQSLVDWCAIYPFTNAYTILPLYIWNAVSASFLVSNACHSDVFCLSARSRERVQGRSCPVPAQSPEVDRRACPFTKTFGPGPPPLCLTPSLGFKLTLLCLLRNSVYDPGFGVDSSQFAAMLRLAPALIFAYLATSAVAADDDFTPPNCSLDEHCPEKYPCCSGMFES